MDAERAARTQLALSQQLARGEYLVHSARMVGDVDDYATWHAGRAAWRETVARMLAAQVSDEQAQAFCRLCVMASERESWKRRYEIELRALKAGLDLIEELREGLLPPTREPWPEEPEDWSL
jgi:hypothetical protein